MILMAAQEHNGENASLSILEEAKSDPQNLLQETHKYMHYYQPLSQHKLKCR